MKEGTVRHYIVKHGVKWQDFLTPEERTTIDRCWNSKTPKGRRDWRYFSHLYQSRARTRMIEHVKVEIQEESSEEEA